MKGPRRLAVIGFGRLGRACARAIQADERLALAGFVRRPEHAGQKLPAPFADIPAVGHVSELGPVEVTLVCVPTRQVLETVRELLQHRIPVVECATLHGEAFQKHKEEIDRFASRYEAPAIVGAGWDPGALSLLRSLFALLTPKGHSETVWRPGVSLHHTTVAGAVAGVRAALSTEVRSVEGTLQHYVYVELEEGAEAQAVESAIRSDPLFLGEEVLVFPVESVAALEEEGHGVLLERRGVAAGTGHQLLLLEARFSETALAAQVMLAAVHALPTRHKRAYSLFDLPQRALWGELQAWAEQEWY